MSKYLTYLDESGKEKIFFDYVKEEYDDATVYKYSDGRFECYINKNLTIPANMGYTSGLYRSASNEICDLPITPIEITNVQITTHDPDKVIFTSVFSKTSELRLPRIIIYSNENTTVNLWVDAVVFGKWK